MVCVCVCGGGGGGGVMYAHMYTCCNSSVRLISIITLSTFLTAWIIYALLVFVLGVVTIVVYFGLRYATTWTINFALGLL